MLHYISDKWDSNTLVSETDHTPLAQRRLPGANAQYPYLTLGDFLEDKLVRLDNAINTKHYYPGELHGVGVDECGYLLPLKPLFFENFSVQELIEQKLFKFEHQGTAVAVTLRVPIRGGHITYSRTYTEIVQGFGVSNIASSIEDTILELGMIHTRVYTPLCYVLRATRQVSCSHTESIGQ